jgi:alpha-tubulin suppressor-like RCC1 family protein
MGGVQIKVNATQVVVGRTHACALLRGALNVQCWGMNDYAQTGIDTGTNPGLVAQPSPVALPPAAGGVLTIAAGDFHTCALMASGEIYCWGRNDNGQLGGGTTSHDSPTPVLVLLEGSPKTGIQALAPGDGYTCALDAKQRVMCWGENGAGQLGRDTGGAPSPVPAPALEGANTVTAGGRTTCATRFGDSAIWCWGANDAQQAGQATGATVPQAAPVAW